MSEKERFLPISMDEARRQGIDQLDVILISGDAYVDHPSFGAAVIGRVLEDAGFSVGIIAQPNWRSDSDFQRLGTPRLFFGVTSGNVDSMVNRYTPNLRRRRSDVYSPGGKILRPDRATIVYANRIRALYPEKPIIIGGIEASLRRFAHYDYWSDSVRRSVLADLPAEILVFGMGEKQIVEIASRMKSGDPISLITDVPGTVYKMELKRWRSIDPDDMSTNHEDIVVLPSFEEVSFDKRRYALAFRLHYKEQDPFQGRLVAQPHPKTVIIQNRPSPPLTTEELDHIYELSYTRRAHPTYEEEIPALEPVRFSITTHRGCFGSCAFCALAHHQGRIIQSRSIESILREARRLTEMEGFRGIIQDVGGPTANMYGMHCIRWSSNGACQDKLCTADCESLISSHAKEKELLERLREIPGVKKVFVSSGIRHDLLLWDKSGYLEELSRHHVSGHLKVAPEHISKRVTDVMRKPSGDLFDAFRVRFEEVKKELGLNQYLLPYFMSGHPGCTIEDMVELAEYIRDHRLYTEQVQDFTPTPMTVSTCIYHTGLDPFTIKEVHVPKGREKLIQRALLHYRDPKNWGLVREGLRMAGREDLIGDCPRCLVPGRTGSRKKEKLRGKRAGKSVGMPT